MKSMCVSKSDVENIARTIAKEEAQASQKFLMKVIKTTPLSEKDVEHVVDRLMPDSNRETHTR